MNGITFFLCIGKPVWPGKIECNRNFWRLVVGPFAFWVMFHDFEELLAKLKDEGVRLK